MAAQSRKRNGQRVRPVGFEQKLASAHQPEVNAGRLPHDRYEGHRAAPPPAARSRPGFSGTIAAFSSSVHPRRGGVPVSTSTRRKL